MIPMTETTGGDWVVETKSLDEELQTRSFGSKDQAIDYAVVWFVGGYVDMEPTPEGMAGDALELIERLRSGQEFYCSRLFETVTVKPKQAAE